MNTVLAVALDLLRQAAARRWILALGIGVTLALLVLGVSLRMDVIDGALAAASLFGKLFESDVRAADVALRPVFRAAAYVIFYGFSAFLVVACADFAPSLLAPGRVEALLAMPVRRWHLLMGTYLGVVTLSSVAALYGASGLCLILGVKTGVWTARPLAAALLGSLGFSAIYAAMLAAAVVVRSAALSAAVGATVYAAGIVAGYRTPIADALTEGLPRTIFRGVTFFLPRLSRLANEAGHLAGGMPVSLSAFGGVLVGVAAFSAGLLAFAIWLFDRKDY